MFITATGRAAFAVVGSFLHVIVVSLGTVVAGPVAAQFAFAASVLRNVIVGSGTFVAETSQSLGWQASTLRTVVISSGVYSEEGGQLAFFAASELKTVVTAIPALEPVTVVSTFGFTSSILA